MGKRLTLIHHHRILLRAPAEIFAALKADLVPLLQRIMASPRFQNDKVRIAYWFRVDCYWLEINSCAISPTLKQKD